MSECRALLAVSGPDRPGVAADVTVFMANAACNIESATTTRLAGRFIMMLVVMCPHSSSSRELGNEIVRALTQALPYITATAFMVDDQYEGHYFDGTRIAVTVYGADRVGIVAGLTRVVADAGANVDNLATRNVKSEDESEYGMLLDISAPQHCDVDALLERLRKASEELGVTCFARRL